MPFLSRTGGVGSLVPSGPTSGGTKEDEDCGRGREGPWDGHTRTKSGEHRLEDTTQRGKRGNPVPDVELVTLLRVVNRVASTSYLQFDSEIPGYLFSLKRFRV